jgi:(E)-4-hydroxy-3-methylbut-2-enyl-diphosphate synthase
VSLSEAPENEITVAKEILHFVTGSECRVSNPSTELKFKKRDISYKPEVLSFENGRYVSETGDPYDGKIITFKADYRPLIPQRSRNRLILNPVFSEDDPEKLAVDVAALLGKYFITKQADGICISNTGKVQGEYLKKVSFSILQETEARITRTTYLSCPTCGRTKFDLQEAVKEVKSVTGHLKGLKIAVMGCIVNGPGEMAGADYGFVGTGNGKVNIYRGTVPVLKNIPREMAVKELVKIIEKDYIENRGKSQIKIH